VIRGRLCGMDDDRLETLLEIYREMPIDNGDMLLITDPDLVQEVEGMADQWDPVLRRNVAYVLRELGVSELRLAIARPEGELLPQDHALWADLREELLDQPIRVFPLIALPSAA
jgi:hypothetical protein